MKVKHKIKDIPLDKAKDAKKESKHIEFKEKFDVNKPQDWCEIIKDIIAMANSGGGWAIIGAHSDGTPSKADVSQVLELDPAVVTDKIAKYVGEQFAEFDIQEMEKEGHKLAAIQIYGVPIPLIFMQQGNYDIGGGKQKSAFAKGTVYFRHGAKSEPGDTKDLRDCINREIEEVKKSWLGNIRKVVKAPAGHRVAVLPPEVVESTVPGAMPIRIVDDARAPAYRKIDPDQTHPHRQKEIIKLVNDKIGERKRITSHDILCVRKIHNVDKSKPNLFYKSKFSSPQYSNAFGDWIIEQYEKDPLFFDKAREEWKKK